MRKVVVVGVVVAVLGLLSAALGQEANRMFLPVNEVDNLGASKLAVDADGGIHIVSRSIVNPAFYYFYCPPGCTGAEQMSEVPFTSEGLGPTMSLALDPQGRPHILVKGFESIGYAHCDGDCRTGAGWKYGILTSFEVGSDQELDITGDALAVGPDGSSHFLAHKPYDLIDQQHSTWYYNCATDCHLAGNWTGSLIEPEQNYTYADLEVKPDGSLAAGLVAQINYDLGMDSSIAAYMECRSDCGQPSSWLTVGLNSSYDAYMLGHYPTMSMELSSDGKPRLAYLADNGTGDAVLMWAHCSAADCTDGSGWLAEGLVDSTDRDFDNGVHLVLDQSGNPRISYAVTGNILSAYCTANCDNASSEWSLDIIEAGSEIPEDDIFLYSNCVIGAWFLKDPQTGYLPQGGLVSVYTAEDYSFGGSVREDPTRPDCPIGVDMSLGRLSLLGR